MCDRSTTDHTPLLIPIQHHSKFPNLPKQQDLAMACTTRLQVFSDKNQQESLKKQLKFLSVLIKPTRKTKTDRKNPLVPKISHRIYPTKLVLYNPNANLQHKNRKPFKSTSPNGLESPLVLHHKSKIQLKTYHKFHDTVAQH